MKSNNSRLALRRSRILFCIPTTLTLILSAALFSLTVVAQTDQSFQMPQAWANNLTPQKQWGNEHPRLLGDVNADRRHDIVGFGDDGVYFATSTGASFNVTFALGDFGFHQRWRVAQHVRLVGDINGDSRDDIVGFGTYGVTIALSNGVGFAAPQFVYAGFGTAADGWQLDRHPRMMANVNRDGRQDIVGFANNGVWVARSNGNGFEPAQFVVSDFGYDSGWRVSSHPRFVTDLNGDGYQDIVGFGNDAIYCALGGANGFGAIRAVMRLGFSESNFGAAAFQLCGDVNGDNMSDLIGFDYSRVRVTRSSNQPMPLPPAMPTGVRITNATINSLTIAWNDNSSDELRFLINYTGSGATQTTTAGKDTTTQTISSLTADTRYCVNVRAESLWGISSTSATVCGETNTPPVNNGPFTASIMMTRQPVNNGPIPYAGTFGPITSGAIISKINFPTQFPAVVLLKPNRSTQECWNPDAVVRVHGDMTPEQIKAVWGTPTITLNGQQALPFVGCSLSQQPQPPSWLPVNIIWSKPSR